MMGRSMELRAGGAQGVCRSCTVQTRPANSPWASRRVRAHHAKAAAQRDPRARQRGDMEAVARVVLDVAQIYEGSLAQVVVGQAEVPDLCGDHRLRGG